jgi:cellulose 1,4-beta-cellobiosidase
MDLLTGNAWSQANSENWVPSCQNKHHGTGNLGSCCAELDIWEANRISTAFAAHPCRMSGQQACVGDACGGARSPNATAQLRYASNCDPDGCDFNAWRQGNRTFYGPGVGFEIDSTRKITVVTRFPVDQEGKLATIRRLFVQDDRVVFNPQSIIPGIVGHDALTDAYCVAQKAVFGDEHDFSRKGGLAQMGDALRGPMVLVLSLWDDVSDPSLQVDYRCLLKKIPYPRHVESRVVLLWKSRPYPL